MHIPKKGLRALGIAESYSGRSVSRLAGVVMRKDLRVDGFCFSTVTVGGMDATVSVLRMVHDLDRNDINVIMLSGCVIAWFNIMNPALIAQETRTLTGYVRRSFAIFLMTPLAFQPTTIWENASWRNFIPIRQYSFGHGV
jgi:hypothetical protein